jgi:outer membrane protein assembly factor BamB
MLRLKARRNAAVGMVLVMIGAIVPAGAVMSASSDLPQLGDIPLYRVNGTANGIQPGPGPTREPELAWRVDVGNMHMVPILVNGLLVVGTNDGHLVALDARTGAIRWNTALGTDVIHPALASMDGLAYATDNFAVYAVDLSTGLQRWSVPTNSTTSRVNAVDGVVYTGLLGGVLGLDAQSGREVWRWEGPPDVGVSAGPIADGVGYFAALDGRVYAIDLATKQEVWRLQTISTSVASGQVVGDTFYVSTGQSDAAQPVGEIYAVDRASGDVRWRFRAPSGLQLKEGPVRDGVLYANGTDDGIWALRDDGSIATVVWHVDAPASHWPMSMVGTTLYEVRIDGSVGAYDSVDGHLLWETEPEGDWAGGPIVSGGMVFLNNDTAGVMAFADAALIAQLPQSVAAASPSPAASSSVAANPFTFVQAFSWQDTGIATPLGMAPGPDGLLYILDTKPQVTVIDPSDGHVVRRWGRQGAGPGEFDVRRMDDNPGFGKIAVAPDGQVYVADGTNSRVQVFAPDGTFLHQFGSFGTNEGQFPFLDELAIGPDGSIYTGPEWGPISKFTPDGKFVWRNPITEATEGAFGYVVRSDGALLASCAEPGQIFVLSPQDGNLVERLDVPEIGQTCGQLSLDPEGNIYVVLFGGAPPVQGKDSKNALLVFDPDGEYLGGRYIEPGMRQGSGARTISYGDTYEPSPVFLPDGRAFTFGEAGLVELKVTLPDRG